MWRKCPQADRESLHPVHHLNRKYYIAVTSAMKYRGGVGEDPHAGSRGGGGGGRGGEGGGGENPPPAGVPPLHPVPHPSEKRYSVDGSLSEMGCLVNNLALEPLKLFSSVTS
jgi:hypothetical protein